MYAASGDGVTIQVIKATSRTAVSVRPPPLGKSGPATVSVRVSSAAAVTGTAQVVVSKDGQVVSTHTVALTSGRGSVSLPGLGAGSYRVTATYAGSPTSSPRRAPPSFGYPGPADEHHHEGDHDEVVPGVRTALVGRLGGWLRRGRRGLAVGPAKATEGDLTTDLVGWWKLDETSGTVAADSSGNGRAGTVTGGASWNAGDGFTFTGGAASAGNGIRLPDNLLAGLDDLTVDFDVWVDPTLTGNWFMFNLGNVAHVPQRHRLPVRDRQGLQQPVPATIAEDGFATEQSASRAGGLPTGVWKHVTSASPGAALPRPARRGSTRTACWSRRTRPHDQPGPDGNAGRHDDPERARPVGVRR